MYLWIFSVPLLFENGKTSDNLNYKIDANETMAHRR